MNKNAIPPVTISFLTNQLAVFSRAVKHLWILYNKITYYMVAWRCEISFLVLKGNLVSARGHVISSKSMNIQ